MGSIDKVVSEILPEVKAHIHELINLASHTTHNFSYHTETGLWDDYSDQKYANWKAGYAFVKISQNDLHGALFFLNKCVDVEQKQPRIKNRRFETARDAVLEALRLYALTTIYLNVPFKEKDAAKSLGARFDGERKQWFIPPGFKADPFTKWIAQ